MCRPSKALPAIVALSFVGCPVGVPPLSLMGGAGATSAQDHAAHTIAVGGVAVRPLGLVGTLHDRPVDPSVGFHVEGGSSVLRYGPTLGVWAFPINESLTDSPVAIGAFGRRRWRLGGGLEARALRDESGSWGPSGALQVVTEYVKFFDGCAEPKRSRNVLIGCGYGEGSAGGILEGAAGSYAGRRVWTFSAGVIVRWPAAGAILIPFPGR